MPTDGNLFGKFWGGMGGQGSGLGGRKALGDPGVDIGVSWVWGWLNAWFERCQWLPCRVTRVGWRIGQAVLDVYHIVVGSWE